MFLSNLHRRTAALAIYLDHASTPGINNKARSAHYRSATVLLCTIVEGVVYFLVKRHSENNSHIIEPRKELKKIHTIPTTVFQRSDIVLAKEVSSNLCVDDDGASFAKLNNYLKRNNVVNQKEFRKLDFVRTERNRLHLQGLPDPDTGYTKNKFNKISDALNILISKI